MEFEFDKEMDSLLRQAARSGETVFAANSLSGISHLNTSHLDADEISLFAENLLSAKQRASAITHLADCPRCRNVLAEFAKINIENLAAEPAPVASVIASFPWYKTLFAFPKLGFAMGALALVFSGVIVFFVLQNSQETTNSSIAQMEKTSADSDEEVKSAPATQMSANSNMNTVVAPPSFANSNMTSAILSTNTANATSTNTTAAIPKNNLASGSGAVSGAGNANIASTTSGEITARQIQELPVTTSALPYVSPKKAETYSAASPKPAARENNYPNDGATADSVKSQNEITQNSVVQNQQSISPDAQSVRRSSVQNGRAGIARQEEERADNKKAKDKAVESKTAGGKVFRFADGIWYDSAYNNQRPTNIRRGSEEYKKLDANLRSIADKIGGVVIIIWRGTAYRIQ